MRVITWSVLGLILIGCTGQSQIKSTSNTQSSYHEAATLQVELGLTYLEQGEIERAKVKLLHALELAPRISETHTGMAYFFEKVGDQKSAKQEYLKALRFKTEKSEAALYNNYGAFLCRQKQFLEADRYFEKAVSHPYYAKSAKVYENRGVCSMEHKDYSNADRYLRIAMNHNPKDGGPMLALVRLKVLENDIAQAKSLLEEYHKHFSKTPESERLEETIAAQNTVDQKSQEQQPNPKAPLHEEKMGMQQK